MSRQAIIRALTFAFLLLIGLIVGVVAYTHWSMRQLRTPLPANQELLDLLTLEGGPTSISYISTASLQDKLRGEIVFPAFVLRWDDGRRFVIDMGMDGQGAQDYYRKMGWQYKSDGIKSHGSVAQQLGAEISSVAGLGFTHLHEDHVQGVKSFCRPGAKDISLFQTAQQAHEHNYTTKPGVAFVEKADCIAPQVLAGDGPLHSVPGFPGLAMIPVAGHSPDSTVFVAAVGGKLWIIGGDISWQRQLLLANKPKQVSLFRALFIPEDEQRLSELRQWLAQLDKSELIDVLLCHDGLALQAYGPPELKLLTEK